MYFPEEQLGDYAVEAPPAGFELENTDVMVFQQRDLEEGDLTYVSECLTTSLNDLAIMMRSRSVVAEGLKNGNSNETWRVMHSRLARASVRSRCSGSTLAYESVGISPSFTTVMALEEEEKETRGVIRRIIDNIVNAFKWLWKKISGLFASGTRKKKQSDQEAKLEKAGESVEKAAEAMKEANVREYKLSDLPELEKAAREFASWMGFAGSPLHNTQVIDAIELYDQRLVQLKDLLDAANASYINLASKCKDINLDQTAAELLAFADATVAILASGLKHFKNLRVDELYQYGVSKTDTLGQTQPLILDGFGKGKVFTVWTMVNASGREFYQTGFSDAKVDYSKVVPELPTGHAADAILKALEKVLARRIQVAESFEKIADRNIQRTAELDRALQHLFNADGGAGRFEEINGIMSLIQGVGRTINNFSTTVMIAFNNIEGTCIQAAEWLNHVNVAVKRAADAVVKEKDKK